MLLLNRRTLIGALGSAALVPGMRARAADAAEGYALSLYGDVKYPPDFTHFDYVDPDAPQGGFVRFGDIGTFDNVNPFILKGSSFVRFANSFMGSGALFDSLMTGSADEPATVYGLIAQTATLAPDRMSVTFALDPRARFHDGKPIRPEDVLWTYRTLITKGHPSFRVILADVAGVEVLDERRVRFAFKTATNRQLPLDVAGLPVLPEHWWQGKEFDKPTLTPLLGNGAYRMAEVQPGRAIIWERTPDYWARALPAARGMANFDRVQVDYYLDNTVMREAFKAGLIDVREENTASDWFTAYDFPAVQKGLVKKEEVHHGVPQGMQSFIFNTRRPLFQDIRVRRALGYAFDFVWYNKTYFYDSYKRTTSYFENSDMAARGLPEGQELALLERYRDRLSPTVFTEVYEPPTYPDQTAFKNGLRQAFELLKAAGWSFKNGRLVSDADGHPFEFEFLLDEPRLEKVILPFLKNLERLGIRGTLRNVDSAQYDNRTRDFDYDMIWVRYGASLNPGSELRQFYSSAAVDTPGSANSSGIKDPVVDELVELIVNSDTRPELVTRVMALDRVLLHGYYCIPTWYSDFYRIAYWDKFGQPAVRPRYVSMAAGAVPMWWVIPDKSSTVAAAQEQLKQP